MTIRSTRSAWSGNCSTGSAPGTHAPQQIAPPAPRSSPFPCILGRDRLPSPALGLTGSNSTHRGSNPLSPASHSDLFRVTSCTLRRGDISEGQRPRARSLARNFGRLAPKGANLALSLCSRIFQYPKFGSRKVQRPVGYPQRRPFQRRGDRWSVSRSSPMSTAQPSSRWHLPAGLVAHSDHFDLRLMNNMAS
jgi:hypothetical protein